jgi:hypothetical protein
MNPTNFGRIGPKIASKSVQVTAIKNNVLYVFQYDKSRLKTATFNLDLVAIETKVTERLKKHIQPSPFF